MGDENEPNHADQWQDRSMDAVYQFGLALKELHQSNPWPDLPLLPSVMKHLMTELWDQGFSQTEIRQAFDDAVADLPRYAAGEEVRS
ncbi:hypothetical protein RCO27_03720 [Sphingosinicella sp. LHD-64]|uniref:hypothetical protein n=1 Tax=Sphingosinicella sp. LHD-64 TaxID=3072139 RepID=UPI0028108A01|nr:hypothetical protein [Sphingosinicella sp. LHD-64]MDQ8755328.1 hypothetical protein [Sphingosinicella sp. LHD-64]